MPEARKSQKSRGRLVTGNPSFYWHRLTSDNLTITRKKSLHSLVPWSWVRDCCRKGDSCLSLCLFSDWDVSFQCVHQFTLNTLGRRNNCFCHDSRPSCWEKPLGAEEGSRQLLGCPGWGSRGTAHASTPSCAVAAGD